jgi:HemX protein
MSSAVLHAAALLAYLAASVLYGANLALKAAAHVRRARLCFLAAVLIHTAAIGALCLSTHRGPFVTGFGTLSVAAWAVALLYLPVEFLRRVPALGALAAPVCCVLLFGAFLPAKHAGLAMAPILQSGVIVLHILLMVFSFALFALAACCAVFYVWQYGLLKHPDRRALFRRLPPLETVDAMAFHMVAFALPLLTLGLALGIERAASGGLHGNWLADPHTLISFVAWLVYGVYLFARTVGGWRGTRLNYLLIAGMAVTLALFFIPSTAHRFT